AADGAASPFAIDGSAVVVAELDDDEVAGLQIGADIVPQTLILEGAATATAAGAVVDAELLGVEVVFQVRGPTSFATVVGGRIADNEERGCLGVRWHDIEHGEEKYEPADWGDRFSHGDYVVS